MTSSVLFAYALMALLPMSAWLVWSGRRERKALRNWRETVVEAGITPPATLHPVVDPAACLGCGACVDACPEGEVLGLVNGLAEMVDPSACIGHGQCQRVCPNGAISLVFGTRERGVDIPLLSSEFQTSVSGVFVAGELGGMGLVRNAITQGKEAIDAIANRGRGPSSTSIDVVIVGAGPAGLAATLAAADKGLRYVTIEQDRVGGTVAHFPRGKVVMTAPVDLPLFGTLDFREISKEALLEKWHQIIAATGIELRERVRFEGLRAVDGEVVVVTDAGELRARNVLLAIGRRGTPRELGVAGEHLSKVTYSLTDPVQYAGQRVLVVGGGDSAIEAALAIAEQPESEVLLSYRSPAFSRAKNKNRQRIADPPPNLEVLTETRVAEISEGTVSISFKQGHVRTYDNDSVIICAGGVLPTALLASAGIEFRTHYGVAA